jgi:hypothetical protein
LHVLRDSLGDHVSSLSDRKEFSKEDFAFLGKSYVDQMRQFISKIEQTDNQINETLHLLQTCQFPVPRKLSLLVSTALAQTGERSTAESMDNIRPFLLIGVVVAISIFFFICVWLFCVANDDEKARFADNMIRTILGFYIGIVTGLLGFPRIG